VSTHDVPVITGRPAPSTAPPRPLPIPGRLLLGALFVIGVVVAAPSGFGVFWFVPYAGVGTMLAIRRPRMSIGWILLGIGWCLALATVSVDSTADAFATGRLDPLTSGLAVVTSITGAAGFLLFATLAIVFPSGRLPRGRWRPIAALAITIGVVTVATEAVMPVIKVNVWGNASSIPVRNPAAILPDLPLWQVVTPDTTILPIIGLMIVTVVSLVMRYRGAVGTERQQLRWLTAALAFVVVAVLGGFIVAQLVPAAGESGVVWLGAVVAFPCVPIAVGIAVLRYRLYEIDRIVSRTISYAAVTAVLVAVFVGAILLFQAVLAPVTGENTVAVAASTLVVAALFQPLRRRIQGVVDHRFNRARYDAQRTAEAFADRLRDQVDMDPLRADLVATVDASLRPTLAGIWLRDRQEDAG
jgi:hypothetical protein